MFSIPGLKFPSPWYPLYTTQKPLPFEKNHPGGIGLLEGPPSFLENRWWFLKSWEQIELSGQRLGGAKPKKVKERVSATSTTSPATVTWRRRRRRRRRTRRR